jgi:ssDNA-binding Zn-finger/Zn-ribbon topoisomerase 1
MINLTLTAPRRYRLGQRLMQCSRCHRCRRVSGQARADHPCPRCKNPEFVLVTVGRGRRLVSGWKGATS